MGAVCCKPTNEGNVKYSFKIDAIHIISFEKLKILF